MNLTPRHWICVLLASASLWPGPGEALSNSEPSAPRTDFQSISITQDCYRQRRFILERGCPHPREPLLLSELNPRVDMLPRPDPAHPEAYAPSLTRPRVLP